MSNRFIQPDGRVHGVVAAILDDAETRWLCVRRSKFVAAPLKVCFPGGGVDEGETPEQALVREIREELGITIEPVEHVWTWDAPDGRLKLLGYLARWTAGELNPDPHEIAEVLWLADTEVVEHVDAMPTNRAFVAALRRTRGEGPRIGTNLHE
jgi:mutator protein MutT